MSPLVSVVIPSFNSAFIKECVDSVLSQTFRNFELIIVDCSTDPDVLAVIEGLKHPQIKVFHRSKRCLPGSNRNYGIKRASGEFVVCLDADDIITPTFLEEGLFVICCVDYSLVGTSMRTFGVLEKTMKLYPHPTLEQITNGDAFVVTVLLRKELWQRMGGFRDKALGKEHVPEDWDFFVRALASGETLYNRGSYGFLYRKHWSSITAQPDLPDRDVMKQRILSRHRRKLAGKEPVTPPSLKINKSGWRKLLFEGERPESALLLLPEQINDLFFESLRNSLASHRAGLTVLSTCQMETYPEEFLSFLTSLKAEFFSLPDFLEESELWLEFIHYLSLSRKIVNIWYGQNGFFIDNLSTLSDLCRDIAPKYISRYPVDNAENLNGDNKTKPSLQPAP